MKEILQEEEDLSEIVQLVGKVIYMNPAFFLLASCLKVVSMVIHFLEHSYMLIFGSVYVLE